MMEIFKILKQKRRKYMCLGMLTFLMAVVFTFLGTISIVSLSMFLHSKHILSFLGCIILNFISCSLYSMITNFIIDKVNNKKKEVMLEIDYLEIEYNKYLIKKYGKNYELFFRYNNLSRDSQLKLLNYVRNNIGIECSNDAIKNNNIITDDNVIINNDIDKLSDEKRGYCRKRGK